MHLVYKAVGFVDSSRPVASPLEFQRLRLADTTKRMQLDVCNQCLNPFKIFSTMPSPVIHILFGYCCKMDVHCLPAEIIVSTSSIPCFSRSAFAEVPIRYLVSIRERYSSSGRTTKEVCLFFLTMTGSCVVSICWTVASIVDLKVFIATVCMLTPLMFEICSKCSII